MHCVLEGIHLRRSKFALDGDGIMNPQGRSGVFVCGSHPEDNGQIGDCHFVRFATGASDQESLMDYLPPPNILPPFYFAETLPFHWSK
jgi:hypothetical protein